MRNLSPQNSQILLRAVLVASLCGASALAGQAPSTQAPSTSTHKTTHKHKHPVAAPVVIPAPPPEPVAVVPAAPELPLWPVNDKPTDATITWDSRGLSIEASNSSLRQILDDVAAVTGAKVDGLGPDERIFGSFGPGRANDVIFQLLHGSDYNVLMIGDQGQGTPRQILLTSRSGAAMPANPNPSPSTDEEADTDDQPQPNRPNYPPGASRAPMQFSPQQQRMQHQHPGPPGQPQPDAGNNPQ
ncbi:MAG: hypothetical protein ABR907_01905 [Terracidiphilus sp.]|jgi:hypothetical protein